MTLARVHCDQIGEIKPLWRNLKCLWHSYECLFCIWQNLLLTQIYFEYEWAIFHGCKWTINENYKAMGPIL